jgi:hypothetical protein
MYLLMRTLLYIRSWAVLQSALLRDLVQKEGLRKMWKGNSAAVIRVVPYLSLQVSLPGWLGVAGSMCAGCAATGWIGWVRLCSVSNADRLRAVG